MRCPKNKLLGTVDQNDGNGLDLDLARYVALYFSSQAGYCCALIAIVALCEKSCLLGVGAFL